MRKRPASTSARKAREAFGDQVTAEKETPQLFKGGVDIGDQLHGHINSHRRIKRCGWQAVEHFLLITVLCNSYRIAKYDGERKILRSQDDFRRSIINELALERGHFHIQIETI
jgi:hypothetical protein